jgi:hypothetical protein
MNTLTQVKTINAKRLANKFFPNHTKITQGYYQDFLDAFMIMDSKFIRNNMAVINESVWTFHFDKTFFCIALNLGEYNEEVYYGIL